ASALGSLPRRDPGKAVRTYHEGPDRTLRIGSFYFAENRNFLLCSDSGLLRLSRQSEKFRFEQSRKFLLTAVRLKDGTNRDEPRGTRQAGLVETSPRRKHDASRGRASNRKIAAKEQARAMELLKQPEWHDFGPTFASQQLAKRHKLEVSKETLRAWMIEAGLWKPGSRRIEEVHCWRPRRSGFGELVQWDTSDHDWLEGRGPVRYLVRLIDDATSWSWGRFVERDATPFNMAVLWEYIEKNGRMVDVYTDRHSMFAVQPRPGENREQQRA